MASVALAGVSMWAEVLNARAGYEFPRQIDRESGGNQRLMSGWARAEQFATESVIRRRAETGESPNAPLTSAEQAEIRQFVDRAERYNALGAWVSGGWPCLLYPATVIVLLWGLILTFNSGRSRTNLGLSLAAVALSSGVTVLLFYRNYWEAAID